MGKVPQEFRSWINTHDVPVHYANVSRYQPTGKVTISKIKWGERKKKRGRRSDVRRCWFIEVLFTGLYSSIWAAMQSLKIRGMNVARARMKLLCIFSAATAFRATRINGCRISCPGVFGKVPFPEIKTA